MLLETECINVASLDADGRERVIDRAGSIIREGGLVAFPTETVYGLGADAMDAEAAARIYAAKGRPSDNPLIAHIADFDQVEKLAARVPEDAWKVMEAFWPGPLTVILPKKAAVPDGTTGGLPTVAIRMPSHPLAAELIRVSGRIIAAPSANLSGRPSPTTAAHVYEDMKGRIPLILDGGPVRIGIESTIIDMTGDRPLPAAKPDVLNAHMHTCTNTKRHAIIWRAFFFFVSRIRNGTGRRCRISRSMGGDGRIPCTVFP